MLTRTVLCIAFSSTLALGACGVGSSTGNGNGDGNGNGNNNTPPDVTLAGEITQSATMTGNIELTQNATIASGVEVVIDAGSSFTAAKDAVLTVNGTLLVNGTPASSVSMMPKGSEKWGGIVAGPGATVKLTSAMGQNAKLLLDCQAGATLCELTSSEFTGLDTAMKVNSKANILKSRLGDLGYGGISLGTGGDLTIEDSELFTAAHDLVITSGGKLVFNHSKVGKTVFSGPHDIHCDFHIGKIDSLEITNSEIISSAWGMMLAAGTNPQLVKINHNNFSGNASYNIQDYGPNGGTLDLSDNYWGPLNETGRSPIPSFDDAGVILQLDPIQPEPFPDAEVGPR